MGAGCNRDMVWVCASGFENGCWCVPTWAKMRTLVRIQGAFLGDVAVLWLGLGCLLLLEREPVDVNIEPRSAAVET